MSIPLSPPCPISLRRLVNYTNTAFALAVMVLGLVAPVHAKPAGDYLKPAGESSELTHLRTRHSKTFQNSNGTRTWSTSLGSIHFQDESGSWQDIDTDIRPLSDGPYAYGMTRNAYHSFFAADATGPIVAKFETANWAVSFGVCGGQQGVVRLQGNQITYCNVLDGANADLRFTTHEDDLREEILIHQWPAVTQWEFKLNLQGVRLEAGKAGVLEFVDIQTGQRVWFMPKPFMVDAAGARSEAVTKQVVERGGQTYLIVKADRSWLADAARRYPITVDPTFSQTTASQDACIRSGSPILNYGNAPLAVGYNDTSSALLIRRSLVAWDTKGEPAQAQVVNAANSVRVQLYEYSALNRSQSANIGCYPPNDTWYENGICWDNAPTFGTVLATVACADYQWYTWQWNGNTAGIPLAQKGVLFKNDSSESSSDYAKAFECRENAGTTGKYPRLDIDYVVSADRTWNGGSTITDNWSDGANWGGTAPAASGDGVLFDGSKRTTPNMDNNYDVVKVQFNSGAGSFTIGATSGKTLTLSGDITQNSASLQTLNLPIALSATRTLNAAAGDLIINGVISGSGYGLTKAGNHTVTLSGSSANTFSGIVTVNAGALVLSNSSGNALAGSVTVNASGVLRTDSASVLQSGATITLAASPNPGTVDLNFNGTQTINALYFGAIPKAQGTWGALDSTAEHKNAAFTGTGLLLVTAGGGITATTLSPITPDPVCAGSPASLTATVSGGASPSGSVEFFDAAALLGTAPLVGGVATLPLSTLSVGLHNNLTAKYLGDENNNQSTSGAGAVTVKASPVGGADTLSTPKNTPASFSSAKLKANDTGDGLQIIAVTPGTGPDHGSVSLSDPDGTVTYTPKPDYSGGDTFTYTLSNDQGCTVEVTATVTVGAGNDASANVLYAGTLDGSFVARFAGIPGYTYTVEYTESLPPTSSWTKLGSDNFKAPEPADPHPYGVGVFQVTDPMGSSSRYYRTVWPAY